MAHFIRVRSLGLWVDGDVLQASEMELFDAQLSKAINGDEGGVYTPSATIEIGGSHGLKMTGSFWSTGAFRVDGLADLRGGLTVVGGDATFAQDISCQGDISGDGNLAIAGTTTLHGTTINGSLSISADLHVQGTTQLDGDVTGNADFFIERVFIHCAAEGGFVFKANGAAKVVGNAEIGGTCTITGATQIGGVVTLTNNLSVQGVFSGKGRFRRRVRVMGDAGETVSVSDYDLVVMPIGTMTGDRTLNISTAGAVEGDVLRVVTQDSTFTLTVDWVDFNTGIKIAATSQRWLELTFVGTIWMLTAMGDKTA